MSSCFLSRSKRGPSQEVDFYVQRLTGLLEQRSEGSVVLAQGTAGRQL